MALRRMERILILAKTYPDHYGKQVKLDSI